MRRVYHFVYKIQNLVIAGMRAASVTKNKMPTSRRHTFYLLPIYVDFWIQIVETLSVDTRKERQGGAIMPIDPNVNKIVV